MLNKKMMRAVADSMELSGNFDIIEFSPYEDFSINVLITTEIWKDGSPMATTFKKENNNAEFVFKEDEEYNIAYDKETGLLYFYENGIWFLGNGSDFPFSELDDMEVIK